jgi:broad specificity phosphatase PhoE
MHSFLADLAAAYEGQRVMLIGHLATLWTLEHWLRQRPLEEAMRSIPDRPWRFSLAPQDWKA